MVQLSTSKEIITLYPEALMLALIISRFTNNFEDKELLKTELTGFQLAIFLCVHIICESLMAIHRIVNGIRNINNRLAFWIKYSFRWQALFLVSLNAWFFKRKRMKDDLHVNTAIL